MRIKAGNTQYTKGGDSYAVNYITRTQKKSGYIKKAVSPEGCYSIRLLQMQRH